MEFPTQKKDFEKLFQQELKTEEVSSENGNHNYL